MRLFFLFLSISTLSFGKISHIIHLKPNASFVLSEEDLNHFKITLFNDSRSDSLILHRYNNCLVFKGQLENYNGEFIFYDKKIKYSQAKVEHPKFLTSFHALNSTFTDKDSVDVFNKRHHILIHETILNLEQECPEESNFDFMFWSNRKPYGGFIYNNLIGLIMNDSLSHDSLKSIANLNNLSFKSKSHTGKEVIFQLNKGKLKAGKNKVISALLMDSLRIKDAGILIDSNEFIFFSSLYKIHALPIGKIKKMKFRPISAVKSMESSMNYIKEHELEMGCGLYKRADGLGIKIINWQQEVFDNEMKDKCEENQKLTANDKGFVVLHTKTFSISGGKDIGKKKAQNEKRMAEIHEEDKMLKKEFNAPFGYIEPVVISIE